MDYRNPVDITHQGPVRWHSFKPSLIFLAAILTISCTLYYGRSPIKAPFSLSAEGEEKWPRGGVVKMVWKSVFKYSVPGSIANKNFSIEFELNPTWIGMVFIRAWDAEGNGAETFIVGHDIDRISGKRQTIEIKIDETSLSIRHMAKDWIKTVARPTGHVKTIEIMSKESAFDIDNFTVKDSETGSILFAERFGENLGNYLFLLKLFAGLCSLLFFARWMDHLILTASGIARRGDAIATFAAGYLPFTVTMGFIDAPMRLDAMLFLAAATTAWRLAILPRMYWNQRRAWFWLLLVIPASLSLAGLLRPPDPAKLLDPTTGARLFIISALSILIFCEVIFWRFSANLAWPSGALIASLPLIFAALPAVGQLRPTDAADLMALTALSLTATAAAKFSLMRLYGKSFAASSLFMIAAIALLFVGAEFTARHSNYAIQWLPDNIGQDFRTDNLLFWAPKNLMAPDADYDRRSDYTVEKINFRSGNVPGKKPDGVFRIVIMGGSNVWGDRLEDIQDTWGYKLEKKLNDRDDGIKYQVVNSGVCGYNLFQLLVLHQSYLKDLQYDLLVLYCGFNDSTSWDEWGPFTLRELWAARTGGDWDDIEDYMAGKGLMEKRSWVIKIQDSLRRFRLYNGLTRAIVEKRGRRTAKTSSLKRINPVEDFVLNLKEMTDLAGRQKAKIVFTSEFMWKQDASHLPTKNNPAHFLYASMEETADQAHAVFCDTHTWMSKAREDMTDLVFAWDTVHLNPTGTDILSDLMVQCFKKNNLLPH
jgi:GDSL-like Lipase/Acylhydrolase family